VIEAVVVSVIEVAVAASETEAVVASVAVEVTEVAVVASVAVVATEVAVEVEAAVLVPEPRLPLSPIPDSLESSSPEARMIFFSPETPPQASPCTTRSVLVPR
jgi:hypothetical protein